MSYYYVWTFWYFFLINPSWPLREPQQINATYILFVYNKHFYSCRTDESGTFDATISQNIITSFFTEFTKLISDVGFVQIHCLREFKCRLPFMFESMWDISSISSCTKQEKYHEVLIYFQSSIVISFFSIYCPSSRNKKDEVLFLPAVKDGFVIINFKLSCFNFVDFSVLSYFRSQELILFTSFYLFPLLFSLWYILTRISFNNLNISMFGKVVHAIYVFLSLILNKIDFRIERQQTF